MERTKSLGRVNIPDGKYFGLWGGYEVEVNLNIVSSSDYTNSIKVNNGVRGINCKCSVEIIDGWLYVDPKFSLQEYRKMKLNKINKITV